MPTEKLTVFIKEVCLEYSELLYFCNKLMEELREIELVKNCLNQRYRKLNKICFKQESEIKEFKIGNGNYSTKSSKANIGNYSTKSTKNIENVVEYKYKLLNKENEFNLIRSDYENNKKIIEELKENEDKLKIENISIKSIFVKEIRSLKFDLENAVKQRDYLKSFMVDFKKQVNLYSNLK